MGGKDKKPAAAPAPAPEPEEEEEVGKPMPPEVLKRVEALEKFQEEYEEENKKYKQELKALELKYEAVYQGLYAKRKEIVTGAKDVEGAPAGVKGVPHFWLQAMQNSKFLSEFIEEHDVPALEFLTDVSATYVGDMKGFKVEFTFAENPYFTNTVLSKVVHVKDMMGLEEDEEEKPEGEEEEEEEEEEENVLSDEGVTKIEGCDIDWKAGKNLTVKMVTKKGKGKKKKAVTKEEEVPSFFRFFETPDMDIDEEDPEAAMEAIQNIQMEVRVAQYIREEFVPHAVSWFTGEMQDEEEDDEDYEDDEEDEDEEEDEEEEEPAPRRGGKGGKAGKKPAADEDEDEEEEEEEEAPKGKGGKKGGKGKKGNDEETAAALAAAFQAKLNTGGDGSGGAAGNPPECKQQ